MTMTKEKPQKSIWKK